MFEHFLITLNNIAIHILFFYSKILVNLNNFWNEKCKDNFIFKYAIGIFYCLKKKYYNTILNSRIEPEYSEWIQICKLYDNNNYSEFYYDISNCEKEDIANSFEEIENNIDKNMKESLAIAKKSGNYYTRILYSQNNFSKIKCVKLFKKNENIRPRALFIDIQYLHPRMDDSIPIELNRGMFSENNQILSPLFVKRCLEYQSKPYHFDNDYKLKILDSNLKMFKINSSEYIHIIENNQYEICKII